MIALGCDHGGFDLKQEVKRYLEQNRIEYKDFGCNDKNSCDYPDFGARRRKRWRTEPAKRGS